MERTASVFFSKKAIVGIAGFFLLVAFLIYGSTLKFGFIEFDDTILIYENPTVQEISVHSIKTAFTSYDPELYIPLTFLSYQIDWFIGGGDALPFRIVSILLHVLNALLLVWLARLLLRRFCSDNNSTNDVSIAFAAIFAGLLFLVHPLHTETVAWISARKDLLSTMFFLMAVIGYIKYASTSRWDAMPWRSNGQWWYIISFIAFTLGLLSKVMVVTLPAVMLLIDYVWGRKWDRSVITDKIPYALLGMVFIVIAFAGKDANADATLMHTLLISAKSFSFYLQKLFVPLGLSVLYPFTDEITVFHPALLTALIVTAAYMAALWFSFRRAPVVFFGLTFFLICLLPTFGNFNKGDDAVRIYFASDRYAYLPSIGIIFLIAWGVHLLWQRFGRSIIVSALLILISFAVLTYQQSLTWKDSMSLFRNVLISYPNAHLAHHNIGFYLERDGQYEEAIEEYKKAVAIDEAPRSYYHMGISYLALEKWDEALAANKRAIEIDPRHGPAHLHLGVSYLRKGMADEALVAFRKAVEINPDHALSLFNLAMLLNAKGNSDEAILYLQRAVEADPGLVPARQKLDDLLLVRSKKGG